MSVDNLYYVLFYHWVHDDSSFPGEQQRNQVPTGLLMAAYFGCRPVSIFDTRLIFEDDENATKPDERVKVHSGPSSSNDNQGTSGSDEDVAMDSDWDEEQATFVNSDLDADSDEDGDGSTDYDSESDDGTDDDFDAGLTPTSPYPSNHLLLSIHIPALLPAKFSSQVQ